MTSRGFKTNWRRAKKAYRNASHGRRSATWKRLRDIVTQELRREIAKA